MHLMADDVAVGKYLGQSTDAEVVAERGLGEETSAAFSIFDLDHRPHRVGNPIVDYSVHRDGHRVLGQYLPRVWVRDL